MISKGRFGRRFVRFALLLLFVASPIRIIANDGSYLSPSAVVANSDGTKLYLAASTANHVAEFDVASDSVARRFALSAPPSAIALSADGSEMYVATASPEGRVYVIQLADGLTDHIAIGHSPEAVALSPDGTTLYVCNRFSNNVSIVDLTARQTRTTIPVIREPVACVVTADGETLFIANALPAGRSDTDYVAAAVSVIDTASQKTVETIRLPNGSTALQAMCLSPDSRYVYVTHILARYQLPTTQLERGWVNTNAVSILDVRTRQLLNTVLLDDVDRGAANPWGVACSENGRYLCVAHAGTHELSVIDRAGLHERLAKAAAGERVTEVSASAETVRDDLAFLAGLRRRVSLKGNGPRGLTVAGSRVYAAEYFSDSLAEVHIGADAIGPVRSHRLGPGKPMTDVRRGEMLFHDATICFQQWQSCASCHPGDGRVDGLNWDLLNDGIGNPKNTKSLLLTHDTPPAMSTGVRKNADTAVRSGIKHILLAVRPEADALAIDAYLKSLNPVPSPHLIDGKLSESARRGEKLFDEAGCADCHPAPLRTDLSSYDVGTSQGVNQGQAMDTPTLVELWRTSPYLHDGRAENLDRLLTQYNPHDRHGRTSKLTRQQMSDLIEFILSQ
jgi:YVTN family beta-propeller protein